MQGEHIVRCYDEELALLKTKISEMTKAVEVQLKRVASDSQPLALGVTPILLSCSNIVSRTLKCLRVDERRFLDT